MRLTKEIYSQGSLIYLLKGNSGLIETHSLNLSSRLYRINEI